jgi:hypothetical protein
MKRCWRPPFNGQDPFFQIRSDPQEGHLAGRELCWLDDVEAGI